MSSDDRQATYSLRARLVSLRGEALEVSFFLRGVDSHHSAPDENLGARLNDPALQFLPLDVRGSVELFQAEEIAYVEIEGPLPELADLEEENAARAQVVLLLTNGKRLDGFLVFIMPPDRCRVSDVLNLSRGRFLLFVSAGRSYYVNRRAILRVREI